MRVIQTHRAFTLIQLLLVIAVIAIAASFGVSTMRQNLVAARETKTALELQAMLQSALAFTKVRGQWPATLLCDGSTPPTTGVFVSQYLPNSSAMTTMGQVCWGPTGGNVGANSFYVALPVANISTANALRSQLPNAIITQNPDDAAPSVGCDGSSTCYVYSTIMQPGGGSTALGWHFAALGDCMPSDTVGSQTPARLGTDAYCEYTGYSSNCSLDNPQNCTINYRVHFNCDNAQTGVLKASRGFFTIPLGAPQKYFSVQGVFAEGINNTAISCVNTPSPATTNTACTIPVVAQTRVLNYITGDFVGYNFKQNAPKPAVQRAGDLGASYIAYCQG